MRIVQPNTPQAEKWRPENRARQVNKLVEMMDYDGLRAEQASLRQKGIHRGIGIARGVEAFAHQVGADGRAHFVSHAIPQDTLVDQARRQEATTVGNF